MIMDDVNRRLDQGTPLEEFCRGRQEAETAPPVA